MRILLTGASNQIGDFLLPQLVAGGHSIHAVSRAPQEDTSEVTWFGADLELPRALAGAAVGCSALIHLAPVWFLSQHLEELAAAGVERVVAFSSTSRFGKANSTVPQEQALVRRLVEAEQALEQGCEHLGLCLTLLRPTLIYGSGRDQNISSIARVIRRLRLFPIAGDGSGLRQPVHAEDLALAACKVLESTATCGRSYNLGGGETLSYRQMVERIFASLGRKPRIVRLPLGPLRLLLRVLKFIPRFRHVTPGMAERMNQDLVYDYADAVQDFGYAPRKFQP